MFVLTLVIGMVTIGTVNAGNPEKPAKEYSFFEEATADMVALTQDPTDAEIEEFLYEVANPLTVNDIQPKPNSVNDFLARLVYSGPVSRWVTVICNTSGDILDWYFNDCSCKF